MASRGGAAKPFFERSGRDAPRKGRYIPIRRDKAALLCIWRNMKLGYEQLAEQTQRLILTSELVQAIKILRYNSQELDDYLREQLLSNPVLEAEGNIDGADGRDEADEEESGRAKTSKADEEFDWAEYLNDREIDDVSYVYWNDYGAHYDFPYEQYVSKDISLTEHLMLQLQLADIKETYERIGTYIIETLDQNGYMTQSTAQLAQQLGVDEEKVCKTIKILQGFEPAGVCASDLKECLKIQLDALGISDSHTLNVLDHHLEDLARNRLSNIAREEGCSIKEIQRIAGIIKTLEPKPGRQFSMPEEVKYIIPDVIVEKAAGEFVITLESGDAPKLGVSSYYREILNNENKDSNTSKYLTGRLKSALWLIKSLEQRKQTIYSVVSAIVKHQKDFFNNGPLYLKKLTLRQIADELGVHESTVSRSIHGKYLQCSMGLYELKYFFPGGLIRTDGEAVSSESVKTRLKEIIKTENPFKPLTDQQITDALNRMGIRVSRRTIAKYRDELEIASSARRKRF